MTGGATALLSPPLLGQNSRQPSLLRAPDHRDRHRTLTHRLRSFTDLTVIRMAEEDDVEALDALEKESKEFDKVRLRRHQASHVLISSRKPSRMQRLIVSNTPTRAPFTVL